jgi:hypothetical protein
MTRAKWERCPVCKAIVVPRNALGTLRVFITIADHVNTQRHKDALAAIRLGARGVR